VTRQSGKSKQAIMRRGCSERLRNAVYHLARCSVQHDPLGKEFGASTDLVFDTYRKSRPGASHTDLYIAISTARMIGIGAIAERKYAQHGAPVYMYIFTHESDAIGPGTQHKVGVAHALEIPYKFYNILPAAQAPKWGA
jgi:para-nitrobenzyl esterase